MSTGAVPALYSSMNAFVEFVGVPSLTRNSLILIGLTLRTFSVLVSDCVTRLSGAVHRACATRSPLNGAGPEGTLNVALTLAPAAITRSNVAATLIVPGSNDVHCLLGTEMLNSRLATAAPVVFVNVTVVSCEDPGENVCTPGGAAMADAGVSASRGTSYLAATILACTSWSVASDGKVPA